MTAEAQQTGLGGGNIPYLGSKISLITTYDIRYEGILTSLNQKESTIAVQNVRSFGTEGRKVPEVPMSNEIYDYIVFSGKDLKDLTVIQEDNKDGKGNNTTVQVKAAAVAATPREEDAPKPVMPKPESEPPKPENNASGNNTANQFGNSMGQTNMFQQQNNNSNPQFAGSMNNQFGNNNMGGNFDNRNPQGFNDGSNQFGGYNNMGQNSSDMYGRGGNMYNQGGANMNFGNDRFGAGANNQFGNYPAPYDNDFNRRQNGNPNSMPPPVPNNMPPPMTGNGPARNTPSPPNSNPQLGGATNGSISKPTSDGKGKGGDFGNGGMGSARGQGSGNYGGKPAANGHFSGNNYDNFPGSTSGGFGGSPDRSNSGAYNPNSYGSPNAAAYNPNNPDYYSRQGSDHKGRSDTYNGNTYGENGSFNRSSVPEGKDGKKGKGKGKYGKDGEKGADSYGKDGGKAKTGRKTVRDMFSMYPKMEQFFVESIKKKTASFLQLDELRTASEGNKNLYHFFLDYCNYCLDPREVLDEREQWTTFSSVLKKHFDYECQQNPSTFKPQDKQPAAPAGGNYAKAASGGVSGAAPTGTVPLSGANQAPTRPALTLADFAVEAGSKDAKKKNVGKKPVVMKEVKKAAKAAAAGVTEEKPKTETFSDEWTCPRCTLKNPMGSGTCAACGFSKDQAKLMDEFPPLGGPPTKAKIKFSKK